MYLVMIKTRAELETLLKTLNIQVFYNHTTTRDVVNLPFIVYRDLGSNNLFGDNTTYEEITEYQIILHSSTRDETTEGKIKTLLTNNMIPYEMEQDWQEDILMWTTVFDFTL